MRYHPAMAYPAADDPNRPHYGTCKVCDKRWEPGAALSKFLNQWIHTRCLPNAHLLTIGTPEACAARTARRLAAKATVQARTRRPTE